MRQRAFAALVAVLVVTAALPGGLVGTVAAAGTQSHTYTNSQELLIVETGNFSE